MTTTYDRILNLISTLSASDLKRLQMVVNDRAGPGFMPAQGHLQYRFITRGGKQYGPYKYRRRWKDGKLIDHYEGKASPEEYQDWLDQKRNATDPARPDLSPVQS
jgi:hypothetical protein